MTLGPTVGRVGARRADLAAYVPLAVVTTAAAVLGRERAHLASKMLLAPSLAAGVVATRHQRSRGRNATLLVALVGSTVGDWYMNESGREVSDEARRRGLLRRGAGAFAVQQAGLIRLLLADGVRPRALPATVVAVTLAALAAIDSMANDGRPDPVLSGYGALLGSMAALATSDVVAPRGRRAVVLGGGLFLISDATIILGEQLATSSRQEVVVSGIVMATYAAALALLVHGLRDEPLHVTHEPRGTAA
ncbi:lysoplasmalogenase family protein [Knoellia aerolata]|uniref:YhhN family protein n=1 Tax=Knoellia aerolata DSM 18566 TaxID=1385519 RepID=A0A0A0JXX6_9MICO|nr:lysoplasmalogenase family protein [Knoellia aerolata]KGN42330.1 hypothetical protein N801_00740 [Knoellia aerolata DSM 18566]